MYWSLIALFSVITSSVASEPPAPRTLKLSIIDEVSSRPTPSRVELLDGQGDSYEADDALLFGVDRVVPRGLTLERAAASMSKRVTNPYSKSTQSYSVGNSVISLPPGDFKYAFQAAKKYFNVLAPYRSLPRNLSSVRLRVAGEPIDRVCKRVGSD